MARQNSSKKPTSHKHLPWDVPQAPQKWIHPDIRVRERVLKQRAEMAKTTPFKTQNKVIAKKLLPAPKPSSPRKTKLQMLIKELSEIEKHKKQRRFTLAEQRPKATIVIDLTQESDEIEVIDLTDDQA
ncbi:hypothetical protein L596_009571 [Steinernema carpocapsae]|uniref:Uncharacterized protein n=1 Tax=Steinernema carpocapsae TaxID=34508 RepID=A0A4U5PG89_STECR|nr:hypothetical protein L596_009571 [Steinernema carpocapsae]